MESLKLKYPIQYGTETISELKFESPKAKHFKKMKIKDDGGMEIEDMLGVASRMTNQLPAVIDELHPEDMMEVVRIVGKSFSSGQTTGQSS